MSVYHRLSVLCTMLYAAVLPCHINWGSFTTALYGPLGPLSTVVNGRKVHILLRSILYMTSVALAQSSRAKLRIRNG